MSWHKGNRSAGKSVHGRLEYWYTGKFTLDAFDTHGNRVAHIVGTIAATRITLHTTVADLL